VAIVRRSRSQRTSALWSLFVVPLDSTDVGASYLSFSVVLEINDRVH